MSSDTWRRNGVVWWQGALDRSALQLAHDAFQWSLDHPGPGAREVLGGSEGAFYQDHANPQSWPHYRALICETGLAERIAGLLASEGLWLLYEQIWLKEGAGKSRTPWHQDLPYIPLAGHQLATVWIPLDPVTQAASLEFVPGSHAQPLYNPTAFDARDPAAAMFERGVWPELPDIDADRAAWPILAQSMEPGDIAVFHPAILHGGAGTASGVRRRTISLRFFGDDAHCDPRPCAGVAPIDRMDAGGDLDPMAAMARQPRGTPFRHAGFPRVR